MTKTVFAPRIQPGDLITDPSGDYAQHGRITRIHRRGLQWLAETAEGTELAFLPTERVEVTRGTA